MIDPSRAEILCKLERLSELAPDNRFGQSLACLAAGPWDETLWDLEDQDMLPAIDQLLADLERREQNVA